MYLNLYWRYKIPTPRGSVEIDKDCAPGGGDFDFEDTETFGTERDDEERLGNGRSTVGSGGSWLKGSNRS